MKNYYRIIIFGFAILTAACASSSEPKIFVMMERGMNRQAQALLTGQATVNERDSHGRTLLHAASEQGNLNSYFTLAA